MAPGHQDGAEKSSEESRGPDPPAKSAQGTATPWKPQLLKACKYGLFSIGAVAVALVAIVVGVKERSALRTGRDYHLPLTLTGFNAIVTGASSGLGYMTAMQLCARGAHVGVHGPAMRTLKAAKEIRFRGRGTVTPVVADLGDFHAVHRMARELNEAFSEVNLLVLNAAQSYGPAPIFGDWARKRMQALPTKAFFTKHGLDRVMSTNHFGQFLLVRLLMRKLAPDARIVVVTGNGQWQGDWRRLVLPDRPRWEKNRNFAFLAYEDSKLANVCFGRELRRQLGPTKPVVIFDPGQVATTMSADRQSKAYQERWFVHSNDQNWRWWNMNANQAAERLLRAAFVTREPMPDEIYSYWIPKEIMRHLSHHSLIPKKHSWRMWLPHKFVMWQVFSFGPVYAGIGPGCGNQAFMSYFWNHSLTVTGQNQSVDTEVMQEYYAKFLKVPLMAVMATGSQHQPR